MRPITSVQDRLKEIAKLPDNWDSYGAVAYKTEDLEWAETLILSLIEQGMPLPFIYPMSGDGLSLSLEWDNKNNTTVDINLRHKRAYLHSWNSQSNWVVDETVYLDTQEGVKSMLKFVLDYA